MVQSLKNGFVYFSDIFCVYYNADNIDSLFVVFWIKQVEIGTIQKMESLLSDLAQIVRRALQYCAPTRCVFFGNRSNLNKRMLHFMFISDFIDIMTI